MKRGTPQLVGDLVGRVVRNAPERRGAIDEITWRRAVGVQVAERTRPMKIERGVLMVKVASSAWAQELALLEGTLRKRLAELGVEVTSVRFRVGTVEKQQRLPGTRVEMRRKPPRAKLPDDVAAALADVADDDIRAVLSSAAAHNLAWQDAVLATAAPLVSPALRSSAKGTAPLPRMTPLRLEASRGTRGSWRGSGR